MTSDFLSRGTEGELSFTKGMDGQAFLFTRNIYPTPKTQDAPRDFAFPFPRFDSSFLIFLFLLVSQVLHILVEEPSFNPMGANNPKTLSSQPSSGQGHACCPVLPSREPPGGWNQIPQSPTIEAMATQDKVASWGWPSLSPDSACAHVQYPKHTAQCHMALRQRGGEMAILKGRSCSLLLTFMAAAVGSAEGQWA